MYQLHIPTNLNYIVDKLVKSPNTDVIKLIKLIVACSHEDDYSSINLQSAANKLSISLSEMEDFFGVLLIIIKWSKQIATHSEKEIRNTLYENGFSQQWTTGFLNLICKQDKILTQPLHKSCNLKIVNMKWRIDISLHNSNLTRPIAPTIIWNIVLSNGEKHTLEFNMKKFHEIRFNVAYLLKEMGVVKNNNFLKK